MRQLAMLLFAAVMLCLFLSTLPGAFATRCRWIANLSAGAATLLMASANLITPFAHWQYPLAGLLMAVGCLQRAFSYLPMAFANWLAGLFMMRTAFSILLRAVIDVPMPAAD